MQDGISNCRENLTQSEQQRLGARHAEGRLIVGEQPSFKRKGFIETIMDRQEDGAEAMVALPLDVRRLLRWVTSMTRGDVSARLPFDLRVF